MQFVWSDSAETGEIYKRMTFKYGDNCISWGVERFQGQQMGLAESHSALLSTNMCLVKEKINQVATTG